MGLQSPEILSPRDPAPNSIPDLDPTNEDLSLAFEGLDDKSLYEEIANSGVFMIGEEMENCCELMENHPDEAPAADSDFEGMHNWKARIDRACARLSIKADPRNWRAEEVVRWSLDALRQLNLPSDPSIVSGLTVDGTTLCKLKKEDFRASAPLVGESLYAELVIWRNVGCLSSLLENNWDSCGYNASVDSIPTYIDLDTAHLHRYDSSSRDDCMTSSDSGRDSNERSSADVIRSIYSPEVTDFAFHSNPELLPGTRNPLFSETSRSNQEERNFSRTVVYQTHPSYTFTPTTGPPLPVDHKNWVNRGKHCTHLWQFLKELLNQPSIYEDCIRWTDHSNGVFRIEDSSKVAKLWGDRKHRPAMNYDKLSRSIRQYYKKGIIRKTAQSKRLVYQFFPKYI